MPLTEADEKGAPGKFRKNKKGKTKPSSFPKKEKKKKGEKVVAQAGDQYPRKQRVRTTNERREKKK